MNDSSSCGVVVPGNKRMLLLDAEVKRFQNVESHSGHYRNYRKNSAYSLKAISPVWFSQWILGIKRKYPYFETCFKIFFSNHLFNLEQRFPFAVFVHVFHPPHLFIRATGSTLRVAKVNGAESRWAAFIIDHSFTNWKVINGGVVQNKLYFFSSKRFENQCIT